MAKFEEVYTQNAKAFEGMQDVDKQFATINTKLTELGYDVLLNHKEKAEYIPSSRLSEVVQQRDSFKNQVQDLNTQLESLKQANSGNEKLQGEIQKLMDTNNNLLKDLEQTKINTEIMLEAKDAVNAKDLLVFVDKNNIKVNIKGEVLGVTEEVARLRKEKPYLFTTAGGDSSKGGNDNKGGAGGAGDLLAGGMNAAIRKAAGRI